MNKKIIWKLNIIDLIIIAIVLLSLFALGYRMIAGGDEEKRAFTLTYVCEEAPIELLRDINVGAQCADGDLGTELGFVSGIHVDPHLNDGNKGSCTVSVSAEGYDAAHGVSIGDTVYLRGKNMNLIIDNSVFEVYIKDIE